MSEYVKGLTIEKDGETMYQGKHVAIVKITAKVHKKVADKAGVVFDNPGPWHDMELTAYQPMERWQCDSCGLNVDWRSIKAREVTCFIHGEGQVQFS